MKIIGILNQKGGVAKTTTASALAYGLAEKGLKTLVVDIDAQCNLTELFGFNVDDLENTVYEVMRGKIDVNQAILGTRYFNLDILPSSPELARIDSESAGMFQREFILMRAFQKLAQPYDYIIIDTPPSLGIITWNVLLASDHVVVPSEASAFSLKGTKTLYDTIKVANQVHNVDIAGILLTRVDRTSNDKILAENSQKLAESLGTKIYQTKIRAQKNVKESQLSGQNVIEYSRQNRKRGKEDAGSDYEKFVAEFLMDMQKEA